MSGSDREPLADEVGSRPARTAGTGSGDDHLRDEGAMEHAVGDVKRGIDQVADKVKGLLRSGR